MDRRPEVDIKPFQGEVDPTDGKMIIDATENFIHNKEIETTENITIKMTGTKEQFIIFGMGAFYRPLLFVAFVPTVSKLERTLFLFGVSRINAIIPYHLFLRVKAFYISLN